MKKVSDRCQLIWDCYCENSKSIKQTVAVLRASGLKIYPEQVRQAVARYQRVNTKL